MSLSEQPRKKVPGYFFSSLEKVTWYLFVVFVLAGCGFQLRGEPSTGLKTIFVPGGGVAQEIRRTLSGGATKVMPTATGAEATLNILAETRDKQVHTITGSGRVYEFELRLVVRFDMRVPGREEAVIPATEVISRRIITYSEAAPTAKETEELLLFRDMQIEIADRILRQVAVARRDM
jgi:LPS-assembly lipoprotein